MKVLIACEESQRVCFAFRQIGAEAYSCDLKETSGKNPEWHIKGCALQEAYSKKYDLMIAHPPCTFLSRAGARWMYPTAGNLCAERYAKAMAARNFFMQLLNAPIDRICVENPIPLKVAALPRHTQKVQPYQFGHPYSKATLLWLKGLPPLQPTDVLSEFKPFLPSNTGAKKKGGTWSRGVAKNATDASKTFRGIAKAMANQWSI